MLVNLLLGNEVPGRADALGLGGIGGTNAGVGLVGNPSLAIMQLEPDPSRGAVSRPS
jgi:hypothetical protein